MILLKFPDAEVFKIASISYEVFEEFIFKEGHSDIAYDEFLRERGERDLSTFDPEALAECELIFQEDNKEPEIVFTFTRIRNISNFIFS